MRHILDGFVFMCLKWGLFSKDDIRCVKKETEKTENEKRDLTSKIQEQQLFADTSEKEQKKLRLKKQVNLIFQACVSLKVSQKLCRFMHSSSAHHL